MCGLITWTMAETNNRFSLIRIRSRMPSCIWLMCAAVSSFLHPVDTPILCSLSLVAGIFSLFHCYQQRDPQRNLLSSFLCISLGSLAFPPLLLFILPWYGYVAYLTFVWSWRGFWGGIIGIILPYWFWSGWCIWTNDFSPLLNHLGQVIHWHPLSWTSYLSLPLPSLMLWGGVSVLTLIAIFHFLNETYKEKIQVRIYLYICMIQVILIQLAIVAQPEHFSILMSLMMICSSPFIGHFFALTNSKFSNILFCLFLAFLVALFVVR